MLLRRYISLSAAVLVIAGLTGCGGARKSVTTEPETSLPSGATIQFGQLAQIESGPTQLTFDASNNGLGSFNPAGDRIAFQSDRDGHWQIYELNLSDNTQHSIVTSDANDENPVWLPDGSGLIFVTDRNGGGNEFARDLMISYAADGAVAALTDDPADDWFPVAVDASSFLFISERGVTPGTPDYEAKNGLYLGSINGAPPVLLSGADLDPSSTAPLGAGKYLTRIHSGQLGILTAESGAFEAVTPESFNCGTVVFSTTKGLAAVTAKENDIYGLYLFNLESKLFQKLETGEGEIRYPQFSPDGTKIIFSKEVDSKFQLFELKLAQ